MYQRVDTQVVTDWLTSRRQMELSQHYVLSVRSSHVLAGKIPVTACTRTGVRVWYRQALCVRAGYLSLIAIPFFHIMSHSFMTCVA